MTATIEIEHWEASRRRQLLCAWAGPVMAVVFFFGLVVFLNSAPAPSPSRTGEDIAALYSEHLTRMRIGIVLCSVVVALVIPWGLALAVRSRPMEPGVPIFTLTQIGCVIIGTIEAVITFTIWAVVAFRPDEIAPELTRTLNDLMWFFFLFDIAPFMLWEVAFGLTVLMNKTAHHPFPRWTGYLSFWCAIGSFPSLLIIFFKHGSFAYSGMFGYWFPLGSFFLWLTVVTWYLIVGLNSDRPPVPAEEGAAVP